MIPFVLVWEAIAISLPNQTTLLLGVAFLVIVYFIPKGFVEILLGLRHRMMSGRAGRMSGKHNLLTLDSITKRFGGLVAVNARVLGWKAILCTA